MLALGQRFIAAIGIVACCALLPLQHARADVITTFDVAGQVGEPGAPPVPMYPVSGTITIDTTLGIVVAQTIVPGSPVIRQGYFTPGQSYYVEITLPFPGQPDPSCLACYPIANDMIIFNTASLVGYAGGALGSLTTVNSSTTGFDVSMFSGYGVSLFLVAGTATPEVIPEPPSIAILAVGVALAALGAWRRTS